MPMPVLVVRMTVPVPVPMAVPVMVMIGREATPQGSVDDELLLEAESLAGAAMRVEEPSADR